MVNILEDDNLKKEENKNIVQKLIQAIKNWFVEYEDGNVSDVKTNVRDKGYVLGARTLYDVKLDYTRTYDKNLGVINYGIDLSSRGIIHEYKTRLQSKVKSRYMRKYSHEFTAGYENKEYKVIELEALRYIQIVSIFGDMPIYSRQVGDLLKVIESCGEDYEQFIGSASVLGKNDALNITGNILTEGNQLSEKDLKIKRGLFDLIYSVMYKVTDSTESIWGKFYQVELDVNIKEEFKGNKIGIDKIKNKYMRFDTRGESQHESEFKIIFKDIEEIFEDINDIPIDLLIKTQEDNALRGLDESVGGKPIVNLTLSNQDEELLRYLIGLGDREQLEDA